MCKRNRVRVIAAGACLALAVVYGVLASSDIAWAKKGGKGKPTSDPSQLLVYLEGDPAFGHVEPILNFPNSPGTRSPNLLEILDNGDPLPEFGVTWEDSGAVALLLDNGNQGEITLDNSPFLIARYVGESGNLGLSFRISSGGSRVRYRNEFSAAEFNSESNGGNVSMLYDGGGDACGFVIHVHADGVELNGGQKKKDKDKVAGYVSIGDVVFRLDEDGDGVPDHE